jgi:hypothetical protein
MRSVSIAGGCLLTLSFTGLVTAQEKPTPEATPRRLSALRTHHPIVIDGSMDEPAWDEASHASGFIQSEPREGEPASFDTEVRVLYDDEYLYLGVLALDAEPDRLTVNDITRDFNTTSGDAFGVVLDTFMDHRNGYIFQTNPRGAKYDAQFFNEGDEYNENWDAVWHVASARVERGWTTEIAIPFKTLNFQDQPVQSWGINFLRRIRRLNEDSYWSPVPRIHRLPRVSLAGTLEDLRDLEPGRSINVTPYVSGDLSQSGLSAAEGDLDGGGDAKLGVGTGLTLDLTVNTDFSQVEADVQQVNLTRFSLFFPEKRDFFLENSGIFRFGPPEQTRIQVARAQFGSLLLGSNIRGGQARGDDLLLFFSRRIGLSEDGEVIPIIAGARLTGRAGAYQLGLLSIQTNDVEGLVNEENFTVLRVKRDVFSSSNVGAMFINRATMDSPRYNRSFGVDGNFRLNSKAEILGYLAKTETPGLEGDDLAGRIAFNYDGGLVNFRTALSSLQDNFNPEVGFAPRVGIKRASTYLGFHLRQPFWRGWMREINAHSEFEYFTDQEGVVVSRYFNIHIPFFLQSGGIIQIGRDQTLERPDEPFEIHPTTVVNAGLYSFTEYFGFYYTDPSRTLSANFRAGFGDFYSGTRRTVTTGGTLKLGARLNAQVIWSTNDVDLEEGSFVTHLVTSQFNYSFSTNIFLNGLIQYNTVLEEWSSNIRFNWIHRPLSNFFLVYNDRRDAITGARLDRALIAKFTYLIDF